MASNNIQRLRKEHGLTQAELAARIGTTRNTLVKLENGERQLNEKWLLRIAEALQIDTSELVRSSHKPEVVGRITFGQAVFFDKVPRQECVSALVVIENALGAHFSGWQLYFHSKQERTNVIDRGFCLAQVRGGLIYAATLVKSNKSDFFHLLRAGHDPITDVEIDFLYTIEGLHPGRVDV